MTELSKRIFGLSPPTGRDGVGHKTSIMDYLGPPKCKDPQLWYIARKRAAFKRNLTAYLVMVVVFWTIWYLTDGKTYDEGGIPWPVWPMLGWSIGVAFHYIGAYAAHKGSSIQKEYDKSVERQSK